MSLIFGLLLLVLFIAFSFAWTRYVKKAFSDAEQPE